jgi:hypothetical protein
MKKIDSIGLKLSSYQAELFEASLNHTSCSSLIFIRRFMNSKLALRFDLHSILFETSTTEDAFNEIEEEYGPSSYGKVKFSSEELHWIGYIYRYWSYTEDLSSKALYRKIKPDELRKVYFPYHSLDPEQAIERIKETLIPLKEREPDDIQRGVIVLRMIRNGNQNRQDKK